MRSRRRREVTLRGLLRTRSRAMRELVSTVEKLVDRDVNVLIVGESGAGKDYLAEAIHACGPRKAEPFVPIDCAAIPHELFESELFGYEKGTFTDAASRRIGKLEAAGAGTVYFDDIGSLDTALQAKLLRAIEEKRFTRLGGSAMVDFKARVLSSSCAPLANLRRDLLYRINVVTITIPPLRERREDIPLLIGRRDVDDEAMALLCAYDWPGNVRELRNVIERASLLSDRITVDALPDSIRNPQSLVSAGAREQWTLDELEERYIREVVRSTKGNYSRAAEILGINRKTLLEKRKRYGIE